MINIYLLYIVTLLFGAENGKIQSKYIITLKAR